MADNEPIRSLRRNLSKKLFFDYLQMKKQHESIDKKLEQVYEIDHVLFLSVDLPQFTVGQKGKEKRSHTNSTVNIAAAVEASSPTKRKEPLVKK